MFKITRTVIAAFVLLATTPLLVPQQMQAQAQQSFRMVESTQSLSFVTYLAADAMGYFQEAGLAPEKIRVSSGSKVVAAVLGESGDIGMVPPSLILNVRKQGGDLQMFAVMSRNVASNMIYSKAWADTHGVTQATALEDKIKALKGARIGVHGPGMSEQLIRFYAQKAGLDPDRDVTIVALGDSNSILIALIEGRIDGFVASAPELTIAEQDHGGVVALNFAAGEVPELAGFPHIVAFARKSWLEQNPETAAKFVGVVRKTHATIADPRQTEAVRDKLREVHFPDISPEMFATIWKDVQKGIASSVAMDDDMFRQAVAIEAITQPDFSEELITGSYTNAFTGAASQ